MTRTPTSPGTEGLRRRLGLPLLVLYGTGITIGAGIYVLIGTVAGHAGTFAPWSFILAASVMALTVASYAEMSTRYPVSAGEAAFVRAAFDSRALSTATGLVTIVIGIVASAAVTLGGTGYIQQFIDWPTAVISVIIIVALGGVAALGILESVLLASLFTLIEAGGLVWLIVAALHAGVPIMPILTSPPLNMASMSGVLFASLLAFFAFIGFEDLANVVEETKVPHRDIPRAMVLTLLITSILYILVAAIAVTAVPVEQLAVSPAPLSLVFRTVAAISPTTFSAIAVVATLNTILAQMTMASRVIYGMAAQGDLPKWMAKVSTTTGTPLIATCMVVLAVIVFTLAFPMERLAESTSVATLMVFALVNLSLLRIRMRKTASPGPHHLHIPLWVPAAGLVTCVAMIATTLLA